MKKLAIAAVCGLAFTFAQAADQTAQQSKMTTCNKEASDKKGDERKAFMKECLSAKKLTAQQAIMISVLLNPGDVVIVPVHGHTLGQIGVIVEEGDRAVFLAGDSSYTQDLMLRGVVDGPSPNDAIARLTHERIRAYAANTPTVYLVAHDPETAARLAERRVVAIPEKVAA